MRNIIKPKGKKVRWNLKKLLSQFSRRFFMVLLGGVSSVVCLEVLLQCTIYLGVHLGITDESPMTFLLIWGISGLFLVLIFTGLWFTGMKFIWQKLVNAERIIQ